MYTLKKVVGGGFIVIANVYALVFIVINSYVMGDIGGVALALFFLPIAYVVLPLIALQVSAFPAIIIFGGTFIGALIYSGVPEENTASGPKSSAWEPPELR